jgi:hypothetical protein
MRWRCYVTNRLHAYGLDVHTDTALAHIKQIDENGESCIKAEEGEGHFSALCGSED